MKQLIGNTIAGGLIAIAIFSNGYLDRKYKKNKITRCITFYLRDDQGELKYNQNSKKYEAIWLLCEKEIN